MLWWRPDLLLPALGAALAGGIIGLEREYAGRAAGVRTHALISLGAALLTLMAFHMDEWQGVHVPIQILRVEPLRIVQATLMGIGFLGGGVIYRERFNVHGLTTAASIWMSGALGLLFGSGSFPLAIGGAAGTLFILTLVKVVEPRLPQQIRTDIQVSYKRGEEVSEADFANLAKGFRSTVSRVSYRLRADGDLLERRAMIKTQGPLDLEGFARRLSEDPAVVAFRLEPRSD